MYRDIKPWVLLQNELQQNGTEHYRVQLYALYIPKRRSERVTTKTREDHSIT
jgi:hypothetical protein